MIHRISTTDAGQEIYNKDRVSYLSIGLHVLQELAQQCGGERDVVDPVSVELDQSVGGELDQAVLLGGVDVPAHQNVHCVLQSSMKG